MGNGDIHLSMRAVEWLTKSPYNFGYQFKTKIAHRACDEKLHTILNGYTQHVQWCGVEDVRAMFNKAKYKVDFVTKQEHAVIQPTCIDCVMKLEVALEATIMKPFKHLKEYLRVREIEVAGYTRGNPHWQNVLVMPSIRVWRGPHSGTYFPHTALRVKPPDDDPDWVVLWATRNGKTQAKTKRQEEALNYKQSQDEFWHERQRISQPNRLFEYHDDDYPD